MNLYQLNGSPITILTLFSCPLEINGSQFAPKGLLKANEMNVYLSSHTDFVPACGQLQACVACQPAQKSPKVYIPELWRSVYFNGDTPSSMFDNAVYTFYMANGKCKCTYGSSKVLSKTNFPLFANGAQIFRVEIFPGYTELI